MDEYSKDQTINAPKKEPLSKALQVLQIEAQAIKLTAANLDQSFQKAVEHLFRSKGRIIVTGMGKSGIVGQKMAATFSSTGSPAIFLHPAEALHGDLGIIAKGDSVLALSNSGETREILAILPSIRALKATMISITGNHQSSLAQEADISIEFRIQEEGCPLNLAPMASTTVTLALGDALAAALMEKKKFTPRQFSLYHPHGSLGRKLTPVSEIMLKDDLPIVSKQASMNEVVECMVSNNRGAVLVVGSKGHLRGIISDGDFKRHLRQYGPDIFSHQAQELMIPDPKYINERILLDEAIEFMNNHKISVVPVLNINKKIAGLIQLHDLLRYQPS